MTKTITFLIAIALSAVILGCQSTGGQAHAEGGDVIALQSVEAGCAKCSYHIPGVNTCTLGVKIGETAYLVKGFDFDTHAAGLCHSTKPATVSGKVKGSRLVASYFELKE